MSRRRQVETTGQEPRSRQFQADRVTGRSLTAGSGMAKERRRGAGSCATEISLRGSANAPRFPTSPCRGRERSLAKARRRLPGVAMMKRAFSPRRASRLMARLLSQSRGRRPASEASGRPCEREKTGRGDDGTRVFTRPQVAISASRPAMRALWGPVVRLWRSASRQGGCRAPQHCPGRCRSQRAAARLARDGTG